jgi:hypothetical protein
VCFLGLSIEGVLFSFNSMFIAREAYCKSRSR